MRRDSWRSDAPTFASSDVVVEYRYTTQLCGYESLEEDGDRLIGKDHLTVALPYTGARLEDESLGLWQWESQFIRAQIASDDDAAALHG